MVLLIFKIVICSSLLIGFYYLFLEKQRTFKFNRVFLLASLILSYCIPFIKLNVTKDQTKAGNLIFGNSTQELQTQAILSSQTLDLTQIAIWAYILTAVFFLLKFLFGLLKLSLLKGKKMEYKGHKIFLVNHIISPFSFLGIIYLSENQMTNGEIDERIFLHEKFHINEKHSFDILFLEILKIFSWFNPALFFIKKAMITNHEFQADEYVLKNDFDVKNYQHLILNEIAFTKKFEFTHQFNFNNTKKRFIMMTSKNAKFSLAKNLFTLPLIVILFLLFSKKVEAQNFKEEIREIKQDIAIPLIAENATVEEKEILKAFQNPSNAIHIKADTMRPKVATKTQSEISLSPSTKESVDVLPSYPGGINEFRILVNKNFNTAIFTGQQGLMKAIIYFTIDESGNVSNFGSDGDNAKFNEEALRSIKVSNQEKVWTPATKDGKNVRYVFKMPLTMYFAK